MRRLTFERTAVGVLLALVFLLAAMPAVDNDMWWHIRTGQWITTSGFPVGDPFNHTRPFVTRVATDWLSQVSLSWLWATGGRTLISLVVAALATLGVWLVYRTTTGPVLVRCGVTALSAMAASYFWAARPQMVTFVCTAAVVLASRRWRDAPGRWWILWLVPLFVVWANFHGAVVYGFLVLAATVVGDVGNRVVHRHHPLGIVGTPAMGGRPLALLAATAVAAVPAVALNPSGFGIYPLAFHQTSSSLRYVQEYQPPRLDSAFPFFVLLALTVVGIVWRWRQLDLVEVLLVGGVGLFALRVGRVVSFFAEVAAAPLSRSATAALARLRPDAVEGPEPAGTQPVRNAVVLGLAVVVVAVGVAMRLDPTAVAAREERDFPVGAVAWMRGEQPPARLFNSFDWGGYLILFLPERRVSMDGRTDVYDDALDDYARVVTAAPGWQDQLVRAGVNTVVIEAGGPLAAALRREPGWRERYHDGTASVFVRDQPVPPPADGVPVGQGGAAPA